MNFKKLLTLGLIAVFTALIVYFTYIKDANTTEEPEETTTEKTIETKQEEKTTEIEKKPFDNEVYISFGPSTGNVDKKEIFDSFSMEILDSDSKNNSYLVRFNKVYNQEELTQAIADLKENNNVSFAYENSEAVDVEKEIDNTTLTELSYDNFNDALDIYNKSANTFIKPDINFTYLYPVSWTVTENNNLESQYENGIITFNELTTEHTSINDIAASLVTEGFFIEGDIDTFTRSDGAEVSKWTVSNNEVIKPQGVIRFNNIVIYFDSNEHVSFGDFGLVVDSYTTF